MAKTQPKFNNPSASPPGSTPDDLNKVDGKVDGKESSIENAAFKIELAELLKDFQQFRTDFGNLFDLQFTESLKNIKESFGTLNKALLTFTNDLKQLLAELNKLKVDQTSTKQEKATVKTHIPVLEDKKPSYVEILTDKDSKEDKRPDFSVLNQETPKPTPQLVDNYQQIIEETVKSVSKENGNKIDVKDATTVAEAIVGDLPGETAEDAKKNPRTEVVRQTSSGDTEVVPHKEAEEEGLFDKSDIPRKAGGGLLGQADLIGSANSSDPTATGQKMVAGASEAAQTGLKMGADALGMSLGPIYLAIKAFEAVVVVVMEVIKGFNELAEKVKNYSGAIQEAIVKSQVREMQTDMRIANSMGDDLAALYTDTTEIWQSIREVLAEIGKCILDLIGPEVGTLAENLRENLPAILQAVNYVVGAWGTLMAAIYQGPIAAAEYTAKRAARIEDIRHDRQQQDIFNIESLRSIGNIPMGTF